jgi:hypothetical protein
VENNPVNAGMVKHAWQYKWSPATYCLGDIKKDTLVKNRNLYGLVKDWRTYLYEQVEGKEDVENVRRATRPGRTAGNNDFVKKIEKLTGRLMQRQKSGSKKKLAR